MNYVVWNVQWAFWIALFGAGIVGSCERTPPTANKANKTNDLFAECIGSPLTAKEETAIRDQINAEYKEAQIEEIFRKKRLAGFNGNVLIAQKGVVLYEKSFGYAHLSRKDSLQPEHAFQLASLSKPFTAVAILKLYEDKKLSLDDSVQRFFPQFPYHNVTIKDLLSHRSGLPNYIYCFMDSVRHGQKYPSNQAVVEWFSQVSPTPMRYNLPDRSFNYCNTNYLVLAAIVEKASGQSFETYLHSTILKPLQMNHTFLVTSQADSTRKFRTAGHEFGRLVPKDFYDEVIGDKGLYSTTGDLLRFYKALSANCLLKKSTLKEAFLPRSFEKKGTKNYGYGFRLMLDEQDKPKYIYHTGWWKGYNTMMWMSPDDDFVIIILGNSYNRSVYQVKELADVLHGEVQSDDIEKDI
jgi:CubicO group peptidase (beta-lactamase class C family)